MHFFLEEVEQLMQNRDKTFDDDPTCDDHWGQLVGIVKGKMEQHYRETPIRDQQYLKDREERITNTRQMEGSGGASPVPVALKQAKLVSTKEHQHTHALYRRD